MTINIGAQLFDGLITLASLFGQGFQTDIVEITLSDFGLRIVDCGLTSVFPCPKSAIEALGLGGTSSLMIRRISGVICLQIVGRFPDSIS